MPSSGYGMEDLIPINYCNDEDECKAAHAKATRLLARAKLAMENGLFVEWLECFVAAWNETHDVDIASWAGLEEWDL